MISHHIVADRITYELVIVQFMPANVNANLTDRCNCRSGPKTSEVYFNMGVKVVVLNRASGACGGS